MENYFIIIVILLLFLCIERTQILLRISIYNEPDPTRIIRHQFPKIVHLMYFPWQKDGVLKENEHDFNHTFYETFSKNNPDWEVRLWTLSRSKEFLETHYPMYQSIWTKIKHPTQAVDFLRLLVTYHYGGIYWQYDSIQHAPLDTFIPPEDKTIRLFVEDIIFTTLSYCRGYVNPCRNNKPEETLRIANQIFCAYPSNPFLLYCIEKSWKNLHTIEVVSQYDILYIGANAMVSEAYDEYDKNSIHLTYNTGKYITFSSNGSWRLNKY
jgi:hypothetical protein